MVIKGYRLILLLNRMRILFNIKQERPFVWLGFCGDEGKASLIELIHNEDSSDISWPILDNLTASYPVFCE